MTSALRGEEGGVVQNVTIVLIGCVSGTVTRGEGVQKTENFADVIYVWPLWRTDGGGTAEPKAI